MNLKILGNRLLIEPIFDVELDNIVLPDTFDRKKWRRNTGVIHAFGDQVMKLHPFLKKGMRVVIRPYHEKNQEVELRGKTFLFISMDAVIGVIE